MEPSKAELDLDAAGEECAEATLVFELGDRIAVLRKGRGWDRLMLARKLGVPRDRLSKWERGKHAPPLGILVALGRLFEVTLDELITGQPPRERKLSAEEWERLRRCMTRLREVLGGLRVLEVGDAEGDEP